MARIVPVDTKSKAIDVEKDELFGLWKDRNSDESVDDQIRRLRKRNSRLYNASWTNGL